MVLLLDQYIALKNRNEAQCTDNILRAQTKRVDLYHRRCSLNLFYPTTIGH